MSSTKRGGKRSAADAYSTPGWCVRRLVDVWDDLVLELGLVGESWLEPCAGEGNIIRELSRCIQDKSFALIPTWTAVELREECREKLREVFTEAWLGVRLCPMDFFERAQAWKAEGRKFDVTVTNPPFRLATEFIETSLEITTGLVIMLLRLNFIGSEVRHSFFRAKRPARILVIPNRPSFTGDNHADSIEYAWFVWDVRKLDRRTELQTLDLTPKEERRR